MLVCDSFVDYTSSFSSLAYTVLDDFFFLGFIEFSPDTTYFSSTTA